MTVRSNTRYSVQLLAICRTDVTCSVGMFELMPLSRVAAAPAPVAPVAPVEPAVAVDMESFESVPRTSTLLFTYLRRSDCSPPCSLYEVIDDALAPAAPGAGLPAVPAAPVVLGAGPDFALVRMKPEPEPDVPAAPAIPVVPPLVVAPPVVEVLELPPDFKQPVIVTWLPGD